MENFNWLTFCSHTIATARATYSAPKTGGFLKDKNPQETMSHGVLGCFLFFKSEKKNLWVIPPKVSTGKCWNFSYSFNHDEFSIEIPFNPGTGHQAIPKLTALEVRIGTNFLTSDPCFGVDDAPKI